MDGGFGEGLKMKVNFNNLRKKACVSLDAVIKELNESTHDGDITIPVNRLKRDIGELRSCLLAIAFTYKEGDNDFKDIGDEISIAWFDEEDEE